MQVVGKLLKIHGAGPLITIWGWDTFAHDVMYQAGSKRKTKSFMLNGLLPSMCYALVNSYAEFAGVDEM
jgi:hypothetical protein